MNKSALPTSGYFIDEQATLAFNAAFRRMLAVIQKRTMAQFMSPNNSHRLKHGDSWKLSGASDMTPGELKKHSAVAETSFQNIVDHDIGAIERTIGQITTDLQKQFAQMVYSTISASCDAVGNTIDAKAEGSIENAVMAMMEKIEFSADKNGVVTLPEIHVGVDAGKKIKAALESASPEYNERIEAIKAKKTAEAVSREIDRKAKFLRYGEDP